MNVRDLKNWLAYLPDEADEAEVCACLPAGFPSAAKRVVIGRYRGEGGLFLCVNPMRTHLSDEFYQGVERLACLSDGQEPPDPMAGESSLDPQVRRMIAQQGLWMVSNDDVPDAEAAVVSIQGKLLGPTGYEELDPLKWKPGMKIAGPLRAPLRKEWGEGK